MSFIIGLLAIAIGLALLFAGYRLLWVLLPIWGFFAGLWLGITGLQAIFGTGFLAGVSGLVVGFVLGIVFAVLSYLFYIVGVAILGATIGYSLTVSLLVGGLGMNQGFFVWLIAVVVAVVFAVVVLVLNLQKYAVIFITALGGASAVIAGALLLFGQISQEQLSGLMGVWAPVSFGEGWFWWLGWLILAVIGIAYQIQANRVYVLEPPPTRF
ncbi:MAG: DUF4203 domain-containing protein [Chloroflexota bacterium]